MRVGPHMNDVGDVEKLKEWIRLAQPAVMKTLVFPEPLLAELKALAPGMKIIGRVYAERQPLDNDGKRWVKLELLPRVRATPSVDYWEGYNEVTPFVSRELEQFTALEIYRIKELARLGKRAVIGNFSTGTISTEALLVFRPAIETGLEHGALFGMHEYSGPHMLWLAGQNQWDHAAHAPIRYDDPCESPDVRGYTTLRYRHFWPTLKQLGLGDIPIVITEGGIDDVQPRPGGQGKGWKDWRDTAWARIPGIGDYAEQWRWYMWQLSHDAGGERPKVVGAVDFGWGTRDPAWNSFDLSTADADGMRDKLIRLQQTLPVGHFTAKPDPEPAPRPVPRVTDAAEVVCVIQRGEGPAKFAGRAAGIPHASYAARMQWWREVARFNDIPQEYILRQGWALRLPWFKVVNK